MMKTIQKKTISQITTAQIPIKKLHKWTLQECRPTQKMSIKTLQESGTYKTMQNYHKYNTVETTETQGDTEDDREAQQDNGIKDNENVSCNKILRMMNYQWIMRHQKIHT